ncbi:hypothetical protein CHLRE_09g389550v5 [Chlamydomonas reinhardtii]|uniref:J domain-containing protein n=1 Tax=Chlamydomonas reinhardtii TaxID=3055 RepID=A0A2K3DDL2_CHLRE|nr:uncharacterized protein CHLRE_09g389550v5 [Chlamydomonas reinhardtii]PNW78621.1 hypothetical protein CHLRE_09g389550v5 [Chlamydomonas reinhardtii]
MPDQSLYEVLGVEKTATQAEIKKAYRQRALQLHPDKNPDNEDAKAKFQLLQKVYAILGDEEKRKVYDDTGSTDDDDLAGAGFDGLVDYFRAMFGIKTDDIDDFTARYQGGEEERSDLLRYYTQFRGRMSDVFDHLMCSDPDVDSHRLMDVINAAIQAGEVERYKPYTSWAKQVAAKPRPAARVRSASGAGASGSGAGAGPSNALVAAIQAKRAAAANNFFDSLAAKYGGGGTGAGKGGKGKSSNAKGGEPLSEPTDEEFEAARQRVVAKQQSGGGSKKAGGKKGRVVVVEDDEDDGSDADMEEVEADGSDEESMDVSDEAEEAKPRAKKTGGGGSGAKGGVKKAKSKDTARGSDQQGSAKPKAKRQGHESHDDAAEKENKAAAQSAGVTGKGKGGDGRKAAGKRRQEQEVQPTKKAKRSTA